MLATIRFAQNTIDAVARDEDAAHSELEPALDQLDDEFIARVFASPDRAALEERLGSFAFARWALRTTTSDQAIAADRRCENSVKPTQLTLVSFMIPAPSSFSGQTALSVK